MISKVESRLFIVYKHTSPSNKVYIGITSRTPKQRRRNGDGYKRHPYFYTAIQKYGWENFKHEILFENLTEKQACEKEKELISFYRSNEKDYGYNLIGGGEGGKLYGEALTNMKEHKKGIRQSAETIEKRLQTFKQRKVNCGEKNGMYGQTPWNKGKSNVFTKEQLDNIKKQTKIGMDNSSKYQKYLSELQKIKDDYYANPIHCPICNKVLSFKKRKLKTCGSSDCVKELRKRQTKNELTCKN